MSNEDYTVSAKVKAILVRKGVDLGGAAFGVTNGVVTFTGILASSHVGAAEGMESVLQEAALARWLERAIKRLTGVRDVIFNLDRVRKDGARFRPR